MELAAQHAREGNVDKARSLYSKVLQAQPGNAAALQALDALPAPDKDESFSCQMSRLLGLYSAGRLAEAIAEADRLAVRHPAQPMPLNIKGAVLLAQGRPEEAISCIESAIRLAPDYAEAWNNLGNAQLEAGAEAGAVASFLRALELDRSPSLVASASRGLGKARASQGQFSAAQAAFEQALLQQPGDAVARTGLGMTLRELGQFEASVDQLKKALECAPESPFTHIELGLSLRRINRDSEALASLERATELAPDNARAHFRLGQLQAKLGDRSRAAQSYRRSLALSPGSAEVQHLLNAVEGKRTAIAPAEYIEKEFDDFSANFDQKLVGSLQYRAPAVLASMIREARAEPFPSVLDLGCGTGLMGVELRSQAGYMVGVDLSSKMLEKARDKGAYDELIRGDIVEALSASGKLFDLVVATDVLIYLGDLVPFMQSVAEKTSPGAFVGISTELHSVPGDYALLGTGRYAHGKDYVSGVAASAGLCLREFRADQLRKDEGVWLTGGFYLFARVKHGR